MLKEELIKKNITWITYDCFVDCDISVVRELKKYYNISWILLFPLYENRFNKEDFINNPDFSGINLKFIRMNFRLRRPLTYFFWIKLGQQIRKTNYDILYFNGDATLFNFPMIWSFEKKKLIFTIHEGLITTNNIKQLKMINWARSLTMPYIKYFNFFSNSQAVQFANKFPNNTKFIIPLALKNFGESKQQRVTDEIVFFNFGSILPKKNIDLLIDAACNLYEQGYRGFKIAISGTCTDWDYYQARIKYPEIFICDIRFINNAEIKDLFAKYHYLVLPYKTASQSGPLKIAFEYRIPVIVSNQPGFIEEVVDGVNGFIFETGEVKSLESTLMRIIYNHQNYDMMRSQMGNFIEEHFSIEVLGAKYISMFNEIISASNG